MTVLSLIAQSEACIYCETNPPVFDSDHVTDNVSIEIGEHAL